MQTNRWLIGGLVVSLMMNLLLVGIIIGRVSSFGPAPGMGPDPTAGFFRVLGFLSDERRAEITPNLHHQMGDLMPVLHQMRNNQRHVFETLTANPFDPAALEQALAELRTNLTAAQVASHRSFVEMAKSLTPDEREELARAMRRGPWMHRGGFSRNSSMSDSGRGDHTRGEHSESGGIEPPQEDR